MRQLMRPPLADTYLDLPQVTLCAITSVNLAATIRALELSMSHIRFGACKLFTDAIVHDCAPELEVIAIARLGSSEAYSAFILNELRHHVDTTHCLVVQWDGHVLDAQNWRPEFLEYDYIGASWPQFCDGHDVGNGGFSLRSKRLLDAVADPAFCWTHPEDLAIGRFNRQWLETKGIRFADRRLADLFSAERAGDLARSFGYHGIFNMPSALGTTSFWEVYRTLDDVGTMRHDFSALLCAVGRGRGGAMRAMTMIFDRLRISARSFLARAMSGLKTGALAKTDEVS